MVESVAIPEKLSRYVVISDNVYGGPDGPVRVLYSTRTASAACLPTADVDGLREGDFDRIPAATMAALRSIEVLVDADEDERTAILDRQRDACAAEGDLRYVLLPSRYCNMGCGYCGQEHLRGGLGADHRAAVSARVLARIEAPTTESVVISWFGAEPMMGYPVLRGLSRSFIEAADRCDVEYYARMVANGTLLNLERLRVLRSECRIDRYDITIDGPKEIHDTHRPLKGGGGSFDHIVRIVQEALADDELADVEFTLRTNIDVQNVAWVDEYIDLMAGHGFTDDRVIFNLAPVYSWGNDVSKVEIPRRDYARRETAWMQRMSEYGMRFFALPTSPVGQLCAAVTPSTEIVSSSGNLFSCSEYPLVPQYEATGGLGRITELPLAERRPLGPFDDWHDAIAAGETPCHGCPLMPVCGGACPKQWREGAVPCPPIKYAMQERLDLVARMSGMDVDGRLTATHA